MNEVIKDIQKDLSRAVEQRKKIRKRVDTGVSHESHLAYADGLVAGIESALNAINTKRPDRIPEGKNDA